MRIHGSARPTPFRIRTVKSACRPGFRPPGAVNLSEPSTGETRENEGPSSSASKIKPCARAGFIKYFHVRFKITQIISASTRHSPRWAISVQAPFRRKRHATDIHGQAFRYRRGSAGRSDRGRALDASLSRRKKTSRSGPAVARQCPSGSMSPATLGQSGKSGLGIGGVLPITTPHKALLVVSDGMDNHSRYSSPELMRWRKCPRPLRHNPPRVPNGRVPSDDD
jgi:hypothetical protein